MIGRLPELVFVAMAMATFCQAEGLTIRNTALSTSDGGEGVDAKHTYLTGETVYFSFQAFGFTKKADEDERDHIQLEYLVTAKDKAGVLLDKPRAGKINEELTPQDKEWLPKVNGSFVLPDTLFSGEYQVEIELRDSNSSAVAKLKTPFLVRGGRKQPAAELMSVLTIDEVRFFRDEEGTQSANPATYRSGDAIHVRFQIAGFTVKDNSRYQVSYGVKVLRADRTLVFAQPEAASEKDQTFYPRGYLTGSLNFFLDKKNALGQYTLAIELRDDLSEKKQLTEFPFTLQ